MPMSRDELNLMHQLRRLSQRIPAFVLAFANDELAVEAELAFVRQLADMAEDLLRHANSRRGLTEDAPLTPLVIDMPGTRSTTAPAARQLPAGSSSGDTRS